MVNIALDFDDVLVPTNKYIIAKYNEENGTDFKVEEFPSWDYAEHLGIHPKILERYIDQKLLAATIEEFAPTQETIDALAELSPGNQIAILSARSSAHLPFLMGWARTYAPATIGFAFTTNGALKGQIVPAIGAQVLVDDSEFQIDDCHKYGVPAVIYDQPYNQAFDAVHRIEELSGLIKLLK